MTTSYRITVKRVVVVEQVTELLIDLPDWLGEDARQLAAEDYMKHCEARGPMDWSNVRVIDEEAELREAIPQGVVAVEPVEVEQLTHAAVLASEVAEELQEQLSARHMAQRYAPPKTRPLTVGDEPLGTWQNHTKDLPDDGMRRARVTSAAR